MALDKLVDSTQLDSDLTSVANAIRTKGGTSAQLAFPSDFVSAINAISGGGGYTAEDWAKYAKPTGAVNVDGAVGDYAYYGRTGITSASATGNVGSSAFQRCTNLTTVHFPNVTGTFEYTCNGCTKLATAYISTTNTNNSRTLNYAFTSCTNLETCDLGTSMYIQAQCFRYDTKLSTLILRRTSLVTLGNVNAFQQSSIASGGAGCTIYIPTTLYNALGTGTNDYKAASNWSTVDGYGTITWAKIEGSYWETHYGDGTAIS